MNRKLSFYDERTLLLITRRGVLRQLHVPFQVKAVQAIGIIKEGTIVYVEAVAQHKEHKIMYRVLNQWIPYYNFQLIIQ
jgi:hypothetical protein